jgi:hypothetical protein
MRNKNLRKRQRKYDSLRLDHVKLNSRKLPVRPFSSTTSRRGDPLGVTALAFGTPYPSSFLASPFGSTFIILMGMAATLFFVTLPEFLGQDPSYALILVQLDNIFSLYENFLLYEQNGINMLLTNLGNFSPEILTSFYLSLQELVTIRESLFSNLDHLINLPEIQLIGGPILDRANQIIEDLRLGGNNLMELIREIENRLNIPEQERIPSF